MGKAASPAQNRRMADQMGAGDGPEDGAVGTEIIVGTLLAADARLLSRDRLGAAVAEEERHGGFRDGRRLLGHKREGKRGRLKCLAG